MKHFHPAVQAWFSETFEAPSPPQEDGWPSIRAGRHTLILAPTGSGKTLAAFLWCMDQLFRNAADLEPKAFSRNADGVHTLYISPLKALNNDIARNLEAPAAGIREAAEQAHAPLPELRIAVRTGDTPQSQRQSMLRRPPHILITTPESLYLLLTSERGREMFRNLKYLIVDEIHAMCGGKRGVHLSLSLERLERVCLQPPVRIGLSATQRPLERIAAFLGGRLPDANGGFAPRPVNIVDCGYGRKMDLQVVSPVDDYTDLDEATVWPKVIDLLYTEINNHRSTLVFVNMRAQCERIARQLNELHAERGQERTIAVAHHGSISRETRYEIEADLKHGRVPAVIATASLELGIDIGSIDLVMQIQAPNRVSAGLQRVGRSGHTLAATSKGRIVPLFRGELVDCVALAAAMRQHDIEETAIPENCLDVLAQQLVAEISVQPGTRAELFDLVRRSYCYRGLTTAVFDGVLDMLSGRYRDAPLRSLQPRLNWDRVNDKLTARRGARLTATLQGGTIPDRGYYGVYLSGANARLGEMEEEFVFESRVGDVFYLGNNEWRIEQITPDRIIVSPVAAVKPRAPFWKGEPLHRDFGTSERIGKFRRALTEKVRRGEAEDWLKKSAPVDHNIAANIVTFFEAQIEHCGEIASDQTVVGEWLRDAAGEPHLLLHAPFGARVNGAWCTAVAARLEQLHGAEVQFAYDDTGFILRLLDGIDESDVLAALELDPGEVERLLLDGLSETGSFLIAFRHNATRALLLSRSSQGTRVPLWLQRLRTADLLQVVRRYEDFPIVLETYRDCLQDIFDLDALSTVLERFRDGNLRLKTVRTNSPSPMASGLMYDFLASNLYEVDRARRGGLGDSIASSALLAEMFTHHAIPAIIPAELIAEMLPVWQHTAANLKARDAEELFALIEKFGPAETSRLALQCREAPEAWLHALETEGRIVLRTEPPLGWLAVAQTARFGELPSVADARERVAQALLAYGPLRVEGICKHIGLEAGLIERALEALKEDRRVVSGRFIRNDNEIYWCDTEHFAELYRRAVVIRREQHAPASREALYAFQLEWHRIGKRRETVPSMLQRYAGVRFPPTYFEQELIRSRIPARSDAGVAPSPSRLFREQFAGGEHILYAEQESQEQRPAVFVLPRGYGGLFFLQSDRDMAIESLSGETRKVWEFLHANGTVYGRDIMEITGYSAIQLRNALRELILAQLVSSEDFDAFLQIVRPSTTPAESRHPVSTSFRDNSSAWRSPARRRRPGRRQLRERALEGSAIKNVRWLPTTGYAAAGKPVPDHERPIRQARLLLDRHGILVKEWYRRERGFLPWHQLFQVLKKLEWQGEIRRGYFVEGLSGVQFARPDALDLLQRVRSGRQQITAGTMVSTADPALPLGGLVDWLLADSEGRKLKIVRAMANHIVFYKGQPIAYCENYGTRVFFVASPTHAAASRVATGLKSLIAVPSPARQRKKLELRDIDGSPAARFEHAAAFREHGFESSGTMLVLWPSQVT